MPLCHQSIFEVFEHQKTNLLIHLLSGESGWSKTVVFVRNRNDLYELNTAITREGISSEGLSGSKKPELRERALEDLRNGVTQVLLATEAILRENDLSGIERVVQFDFHELDQDYLKRAKAAGTEITTFVTQGNQNLLTNLEGLSNEPLERKSAEDFTYDTQPRHIRTQPKKGQSNRTKSKPLQNKKPKLKNKGPRRKTGRTRKR